MTGSKNNKIGRTMADRPAANLQAKDQRSNNDEFVARMNALISRAGSAAELARRCGFSEAVVRSWRDGNSDPSRERCIALARGMGVSLSWVVAGEGPMVVEPASQPQSQGVSAQALTMAVQLAAEALDGRSLPPPEYAELVGLIYEGLVDGLPEAKILRFARIGAHGAGGN